MNIADLSDEEIRALKEGAVQGMLWYDDTDRTLEEKIDLAVKFFKKKHYRDCKVIALHPKTFLNQEVPEEINGVKVAVDKTVLMNHIFVADDNAPYSMKGAEI